MIRIVKPKGFGNIRLQDAPLPEIMHRRLVAGILVEEPLSRIAVRAAAMIERGEIQAQRMITHRFPYARAKEAFDFLWHSPQEALGVLLIWRE